MSNAASSINVLTERDQVMPPNSGYRCSRTVLVFTNVFPVLSGTWPTMRGTSATRVDAKVFNGNEVLFHWAFPGYRLLRTAYDGWNRRTVHRDRSFRWLEGLGDLVRNGSRVYAIGPQGSLVAADHCRSSCELRVTSRSSEDGYGNDADRIEFRYWDAHYS